ncbi:MAG: cupin domain-containing protein [Pseudohongiellaceae bacterium]
MKRNRLVAQAACLLAMVFFASQLAMAQGLEPDEHGFIIAGPADLAPPSGGRTTVILGDPGEPGLYVIRITFGPGQGSRPHYHSQARYITVIKGRWWVSSGPESDVYDPDNMMPVETGTFIYQPPNGHHYDMAKDEEVIVQIMGMGPVVTTSLQ